MDEPTHLDIFSGIAGWGLAAQWSGFRTLGFVEIERYAQRVLAKHFPRVPIHSDIFDFDGTNFRGVDLITGSPPCQPYSVAGKRRGSADDRAIWPQMFRVIGEARPAWTVIEEVAGFIPMELDNVLSDMEGIGYATRAFVIPACAVDARHRRDRVWIVGRRETDTGLAYAEGQGLEGRKQETGGNGTFSERSDSAMADADGNNGFGRERVMQVGRFWSESGTGEEDFNRGVKWLPEPDVGRVAHGIPSRVDRLKGLGNSIVPQVAYEILREIRKLI